MRGYQSGVQPGRKKRRPEKEKDGLEHYTAVRLAFYMRKEGETLSELKPPCSNRKSSSARKVRVEEHRGCGVPRAANQDKGSECLIASFCSLGERTEGSAKVERKIGDSMEREKRRLLVS